MNIAVIGASGSIGTRLIRHLLDTTNHTLILFSRHAKELRYNEVDERRLTHINGDILKPGDIDIALGFADVAVYLVHLMGGISNGISFMDKEKVAANNFADAVNNNRITRVVYVGGMGKPQFKMTNHLASRQQTGKILRDRVPQLIEFNVPMVIGPKSAGFEVIRELVTKTRLLPVPMWADAVTQPITISDVARYVTAALTLKMTEHLSVEVGGPERLAYTEVIRRYAKYKDRSILIFKVPLIPKRLVAQLFRLNKADRFAVTVSDMIESAGYATVVESDTARSYFPSIQPEPIERDFI